VALTQEHRQLVRQALDVARRAELQALNRPPGSLRPICAATALSGRRCRNYAGETGYCGVHRLSHALELHEHHA